MFYKEWGGAARPFQRKSKTVSAQTSLKSKTVSAQDDQIMHSLLGGPREQ